MPGILITTTKTFIPSHILHNDAVKLALEVHSQGGAELGFSPSFLLITGNESHLLLAIHMTSAIGPVLSHTKSHSLDCGTLVLLLLYILRTVASGILLKHMANPISPLLKTLQRLLEIEPSRFHITLERPCRICRPWREAGAGLFPCRRRCHMSSLSTVSQDVPRLVLAI